MALSKLAHSSLSALLAAVALAACGPAAGPPLSASSDAISASAVDPGNAGGNKDLTVMTWNLYLGAELLGALAAESPQEFLVAATGIWAMVQSNDRGHGEEDVLARLDGVADEIAAASPDLVGLQEVYLWERAPAGSAEFVTRFDYLGVLLEKLAERGVAYEPAVTLQLSSFAAPVATGETIRGTDRQVILARADEPGLHVFNPGADVFGPDGCAENASCPLLLHLTVLGEPIAILRGWTSVDVRYRGETLRFVNTHLEAYGPAVRVLQGEELASTLPEAPSRVIVVGDLNSLPGTEGAEALTDAGLTDLWPAVDPGSGFTSPYPEDLTIPEVQLDERIDYAFFGGPMVAFSADVVGDVIGDRVTAAGGVALWPSDHAGVVGTLRLVDSRFVALH